MANRTWTNHTKPFAWMLIYDTITTNFEEENTFDLSVLCIWAHYKLYKNAWIVGIRPSKPRLWIIELEQITTKPFAWMLIYDTITTNFEGKNTFDSSVPCVWGQYKLYKTAWIVGIGPSMETKVMDNQTWTNHNQAINLHGCSSMMIRSRQILRGKHFWFKCSMWMSSLQAMGNGIGPSKPKLWLIELEQIITKPFAWMLRRQCSETVINRNNNALPYSSLLMHPAQWSGN